MKRKLFYGLIILSLFGLFAITKPVYAEDNAEQPTAEVESEVKNWINQNIENQFIVQIIEWCIDAGVLTGLFAVCVKYRKYKNTTLDDMIKLFKNEIKKYLKESFDELSDNEIAKIEKSIEGLKDANETIMKVLVLMQDSTIKGKATLIDFLGAKTQNKEVKALAEDVALEVEEEKKANDEVKAKVEGNYDNLF